MKKFRYLYNMDDSVEINLSPLIDMMFLLLVFFIVTTAFVEEVGVDIQKPSASSTVTLDKMSIMLGITREGKIVYGGREISLNSVRGLVSRLMEVEKRPVIILADEESHSGMLVDVIDECKAAGAARVGVATEKE